MKDAEALRPRVASAPTALLRDEYVTHGTPAVPDDALTGNRNGTGAQKGKTLLM